AVSLTAVTNAGGVVDITAAVVDPTTAETRSAFATLTLIAPTGDIEPNGDSSSASTLTLDHVAEGSVGGTDSTDTFALGTSADGKLTLQIDLIGLAALSDATIVVRSADGTELTRIRPTSSQVPVSLDVSAGQVLITIGSAGAPFQYRISPTFEQAEV